MLKNINKINTTLDWQVLPSIDVLSHSALDIIVKIAEKSIAKEGVFRLVLAGGTTPKKVYQLLAKTDCDFSLWELYLGDERCLPKQHTDRNSEMILQTLVSKINIPSSNIYFIDAELGGELGAKQYATLIAKKIPFHLVLLGMGEDGHTASLFPGHIHPKNELVHAVYDAPKAPKERISLSQYALSQTHNLLILASGKNKRDAISQWQQAKPLPVSSITAFSKITVLLDEEAKC